jgi:hypothetical protein
MAGFVNAFADWQLALRGIHSNNFNDPAHVSDRNNYMIRAQALLKGCLVHFRRSVKTVAQSRSLVKVESVARFRSLCEQLVICPSVAGFRAVEKSLRVEFQAVGGWLDWWLRPAIASKFFDAFKIMDPALDKRLPDTTNPVEALHHSLGSSVGQGHQLLDGMVAVLLWANRFECQSEAIQSW